MKLSHSSSRGPAGDRPRSSSEAGGVVCPVSYATGLGSFPAFHFRPCGVVGCATLRDRDVAPAVADAAPCRSDRSRAVVASRRTTECHAFAPRGLQSTGNFLQFAVQPTNRTKFRPVSGSPRFSRDAARKSRSRSSKVQEEYVRYENLPLETKDGRQIEVEFVSNVHSIAELTKYAVREGLTSLEP